jgi:hypothetical protein
MMPEFAPWTSSFVIEGDERGRIVLAQRGRTRFELHSTITYTGAETGLEGEVGEATLAAIRSVSPETLEATDLASVPRPLLWLVGRYGIHTPAALIHDRLIEAEELPSGLNERLVDRYFRFMLKDLGVPFTRCWMMWAAVALRTRLRSGWAARASVVLWLLASVAGMAVFVYAARAGNLPLLTAATFAPFAFAVLWGRQYGAALVAAYTAPWVVPPTLFGALGYGVYLGVEALVSLVVPATRPASDA